MSHCTPSQMLLSCLVRVVPPGSLWLGCLWHAAHPPHHKGRFGFVGGTSKDDACPAGIPPTL